MSRHVIVILFVITLSIAVIPEVLRKKEGQRNTFLVKSNIQEPKLNYLQTIF